MITMTPFHRSTWSILDELEALQDDMNRSFGGWTQSGTGVGGRRAYPPVNVWSSKDGIVVDAEMPGVDVKNVDISVEGDQLTLRGKIDACEPKDGETYYRRERSAGEFVRSLQLPFRANAGGVKASYKNGILRIVVPRSEEDKPHRVAIEAA